MRFSPGLLVAVATTVTGQTLTGFTNTTTPSFEPDTATSSSTSSALNTATEDVSSAAARSDSTSDTQTTTTTMTNWSTTTTTEFPTPSTSGTGFPSSIDKFTFFGCLSSTSGFPTFELAGSSSTMDLGICALGCVGRAFFGVYGSDCYCGDEVVHDENSLVSADECDLHCPGNFNEFCGGKSGHGSLQARQAISNDRLLTVYTSAIFGPGAIEPVIGSTESATEFVTDSATESTPKSTIEPITESGTVTVTNELTGPVAGRATTFFTTLTATISGPEISSAGTATAALVCHHGQCSPQSGHRIVYIFIERKGSDYDGKWVYVPEPCSCQGGQQYVQKLCSHGSCANHVVYLAQEYHDWHTHKSFYVPTDCDTCQHGEVMFKPWEKSWGTPDNCKVDMIPVCNGSKCPPVQYGHGSNRLVSGPHGNGFNSTSNITTHQPGSNSGSQGGSSHSGDNDRIDRTSGSSDRHTGSNDNPMSVPVAVSDAQRIAISVAALLPIFIASLL